MGKYKNTNKYLNELYRDCIAGKDKCQLMIFPIAEPS
jgi:hypothetical protein